MFLGYHPIVSCLYFTITICFAVLFLHPYYVAAGLFASVISHLILNGKRSFMFLLKLIPIFLFIAFFNPIVNTRGETVLIRILGRTYTLEALKYGVVIACVFVMMILWWGCYSMVFTGDKVISLFGNVVPVISLLLVMVFRLIPDMKRRINNINDARTAIGKGIHNLNSRKDKLLFGISNLGIMFSMSLESGIVTSDSMKSRGYGTTRRTSFKVYRFTVRDYILILIMIIETGIIVAFALNGCTKVEFYPRLLYEPLNEVNCISLIIYIIYIMLPIILHLKEIIKWRFLKHII